MTIEQIKSSLAAQFATSDEPPRHLSEQMTSSITTVAYQSGRKSWQTEVVQKRDGFVVGVTGPRGRKLVTFGDPQVLKGDTVFEIGSITKVFTALVLCDMVRRNEVALSDPVSRYLPAGTRVPRRGGRDISLADLATHTSGLPCLPSNMKPKDADNPYADYTVEDLYEFLFSYDLTREIGARFEYSNLGVGLLGHALAFRADTDYATLVRARITGPLGMDDTAIELSPQMKARLAVGYGCEQQPVSNWDLPTLGGGGALRSTTNDLLTFLEANLGYRETPLAPAMAAMLDVRRPSDTPGTERALGWAVRARPAGGIVVGHSGGTGGYSAFIGYDPQTRYGVAVCANGQFVSVTEIGMHLLDFRVASEGPAAAGASDGAVT